MFGIISPSLRKHAAPYNKIAQVFFSSAQNYVWKMISHGVAKVQINPGSIVATVTYKYASDPDNALTLTQEFDVLKYSPLGILNTHQQASAALLETMTSSGSTIGYAEMKITDHFLGETSYLLMSE